MLNTKVLIIKPLHLMMKEQGVYCTARHMAKHGATLEHALYVLRGSRVHKTVNPSSLN
jgi:hypothetical protein